MLNVYFMVFEIRKAEADKRLVWLLGGISVMSSSMRTIGVIAEAEIVKPLLRISVLVAIIALNFQSRGNLLPYSLQFFLESTNHLYTHARICYLKPVHDAFFVYRSLVCK